MYDLSTEWKTFPNQESVDYFHRTVDATETAAHVCRGVADIAEQADSYGVYYHEEVVWWVPSGSISVTPEPGDTITDHVNNLTYTVIAIGGGSFGSSWRVSTLRLVISEFGDVITYFPPSDSTDAYLSPLTAQGTGVTNLTCRIQFDREEIDDFQGVQYLRNYYRVYVRGSEVDPQVGATITATTSTDYNGVTFRILEVENIKVLEDVICLLCTVDPVS